MTRLRIAIPPDVAELGAGTGHGNMWRQVLAGLRQVADVETRERAPRLGFGRKPDVWLASGHALPPDTSGTPLVVQVHEAGWADPELAALLNPEFARAMAASTEASLARAAAVITPSEAARQQVASAYDHHDITAVHHGVDLDVFSPRSVDETTPYVLFVGVAHPRKNLDGLRAAMTQLADDGLPHQLALVVQPARDRPDPTAVLEQAMADLPGHPGRVLVADAPTDHALAALYAGAAAFCLPSWFEGFGLPALEALACGAPVVVSDRGALPEVVGDAGIVTSPGPDAIAAGLREAFAAPRALRDAARARAETMPWPRTVEGWYAVLRRASEG